MAKPPITSLASVNGPSVTVTLPFARRARAPLALDNSPPTPTSRFPASFISWSMAANSAGGGSACFSEPLTIVMNFDIGYPFRARVDGLLYLTTNGRGGYRQALPGG